MAERSRPTRPHRRRAVPWLALGLVLVTFLAACGGGDGDDGSGGGDRRVAETLLGPGPWTLDRAASGFGDTTTPAVVDLVVSGNRIRGTSGCNAYQGNARVGTGGALRVDSLGSTMRGCDPAVMAVEAGYLERLGSARSFVATSGELRITDEAGKVLVFRR